MVVTSTNNYSSYGIACAQCNHRLIAPNWSEYVSENHVRHSWSCESCGHQFETSDRLRFKARWRARPLPLLVA
jgi:DNA-directed RNA polymerase subunit RPC12/RpoP